MIKHLTVMTGVKTLFNFLLHHPDFCKIKLSKMKLYVPGAKALQRTVADKWKQATKTAIFEGYGLTEASPVVCCNPIVGNTDIVGTIGLPLPSTSVKLVDDNDVEVAQGQEGELCVQGPQVM